MAKDTGEKIVKIDVYNQSARDYRTPTGVLIASKQTVSLEKSEGESMLKSYPRDLISPDSLRSSPASQSDNDRRKEIERLQGVVKDLQGKLGEAVQEAARLKAKTQDHPLKVAFDAFGSLLADEAHKTLLEADEGLRTGVAMCHEFLKDHFEKHGVPEAPKAQ